MKARKINIPKIRYLLGLLLALLALLVYLSDPFSTLSRSARNMSLEDPGQVNRLIISGKQDTVTLTRTAEKTWTLNGGLEASPPAVNDLLGWLERIRVQAPVPADKGGFEEYFSGSPLRLQWIAGHRKKQSLEILTIPADNRFLVQRTGQRKWYLAESFGNKLIPADFIRPSMNAWRSKVLFELDPYTIRDISLQNHTRPAASFRLAYRPGEGFLLFNQDGDTVPGCSTERAGRYYSYFMHIRLEDYLDRAGRDSLDAALHGDPLYLLRVATEDHPADEISFYSIPRKGEANVGPVDPYRLAGCREGSHDCFLIRYLDLDPVLKELDYFIK